MIANLNPIYNSYSLNFVWSLCGVYLLLQENWNIHHSNPKSLITDQFQFCILFLTLLKKQKTRTHTHFAYQNPLYHDRHGNQHHYLLNKKIFIQSINNPFLNIIHDYYTNSMYLNTNKKINNILHLKCPIPINNLLFGCRCHNLRVGINLTYL